MKLQHKNFFLSIILALIAVACSNERMPPVERSYGENVSPVERSNFHASDAAVGACDRLEQLKRDTNGADLFSVYDSFSYKLDRSGPHDFVAATKVGESPLLMYLLTSEKIRPLVEADKASFKDLARVLLKIGECKVEGTGTWGFGCKFVWAQAPMQSLGCKIESLAEDARCQAVWGQVVAKQELGKCAYVATGPVHDGDIECGKAKAAWAQIVLADAQNKIFLAKNSFLQSKFPGIFGPAGDASSSVFLGMLAKQKDFFTPGPDEVARIVTSKLPLFPASRTWQAWQQDSEKSTSAWVNGASADAPATERLCSYVLFQRAFAQLLALSGFAKPELLNGNAIALDAVRPGLGIAPVAGAFLAKTENSEWQPTILAPSDLAAYNPAVKLLQAAALLPSWTQAPETTPELLTDRLDRMLGVERFYEATSPIASWLAPTQAYLLGDILDSANSAILPAEAHALSFGLLGLDFQNLAASNIKKIKGDGSLVLSAEDVPLGFVLLRSLTPAPEFIGEMALDDLLRFSRLVVRLEAALSAVLQADPLLLAQKNPFYSAAMRPKLEWLAQNLRDLKLPLTLLIGKMGAAERQDGSTACIGLVEMNLAPGVPEKERFHPKRPCSPAQEQEYKSVHRLLEQSVFGERK